MKRTGKLKKIIGIVAVLVLCVSTAVTVSAEDPLTFDVFSNDTNWGTVDFEAFPDSEGRPTRIVYAQVANPADRFVFDRWEVRSDYVVIVEEISDRFDSEMRLTMPETGHVEIEAIFREMLSPSRVTVRENNPGLAVVAALDISIDPNIRGPAYGWAEAGDRVPLYAITGQDVEFVEWSVHKGDVEINEPTSFQLSDILMEHRAWFTMPDPSENIDIVAVLALESAQTPYSEQPPEYPPAVLSQPEVEITVLVDGERLELDVSPYLLAGRTLVPLRAIFEALGAEVDWNPAQRTISAVRDDVKVSLVVGSGILLRNGVSTQIDVPPLLISGRAFVPTRAIADSFDALVSWDEEASIVIITT